MQISAILFDIGGVLVELNGLPSIAKLLNSQQSYDVIYDRWMSSPSVIAHETGQIDGQIFAIGAVRDLDLSISPDAFLTNFATWIVGLFPDTLRLLNAIPDHMTVAALSNTSPTHWQKVEETGLPQQFDALFLSHEIGHLKPASPSFEAVLNQLNLSAEQVIFFDDNINNVNAANALGFKAHQAFNPTDAATVLKQYDIIQLT